MASLPKIVAKHIKGGWENVQSIDIKTGSSAALPVWNSKLDDRWIGMPEPTQSEDEKDSQDEAAEEGEQKGKDQADQKKTEEAVKGKKSKSSNGEKKIRSSISTESISPKATKKVKKAA